MRTLQRKLNSRRGASAIIALVFLLFCATIGAIVLTAASANAGKVTRVRSEQQAYFAVRSAAQLARDEIEGATFEGKFEEVLETDGNETTAKSKLQNPNLQYTPEENSEESIWVDDGWSKALKTTNAQMWKDAAGIFKLAIEPESICELSKQKFTVSPAETTEPDFVRSLPMVAATYQMNQDYSITFTFAIEKGGANTQKVTLKIPVEAHTDLQIRRETWMEDKEDTAPNPETGELETVTISVEKYATIQRTVTNVTWGRGVLTKGIIESEASIP